MTMRQKEIRIALVCYGGISLAVYMHGVTKELWHLARASVAHHGGGDGTDGVAAVYQAMLRHVEVAHGLRLRVLADIVAGASAGGINGVFLAQAIHSGQSLEPLTRLWLERADVDVLLDPDARPWSRLAKAWAMPLVWLALTRPGNVVSSSVAPETRREVRAKLSRLIRSRWFEPPFGGLGFSRLLAEALDAMAASSPASPLLPPDHPLDLFVTATDFKGHLETLKLHSPAEVQESEHRLSIGFRSLTPRQGGEPLADPVELIFASRATASLPGAFPALQPAEIDALARERGDGWAGRSAFLARLMPEHARRGDIEGVSLIDGSVLVNAPFADAMSVLRDRPAQREVDRRFVYIDPRPDRVGGLSRDDPRPPGFFSVIFGSLSSIPREQPVRDNLDTLARQSREMARLRGIVAALRPDVDAAVERLFGHTLFFDRPTVKRLTAWRNKAQGAAAERAGYAYPAYLQVKYAGVVEMLAETIRTAASRPLPSVDAIARRLADHLAERGLSALTDKPGQGASEAVRTFLRDHDLAFRIRRLRLLSRRLTQDWDGDPTVPDAARDAARDTVWRALSLYFDRENSAALGSDFATMADRVMDDPGAVLTALAAHRQLPATDVIVDAMLAGALVDMPDGLKRKVLLAYLGFPHYDVATLPLLRGEGLNEFDPVKVDRISPDDAQSIRTGGAEQSLRGVEFYNFGAFFSRAYRENDYLWGRLHGAERMIDLVASALPDEAAMCTDDVRRFKRDAFLAILDEEAARLTADPALVAGLRAEVLARLGE